MSIMRRIGKGKVQSSLRRSAPYLGVSASFLILFAAACLFVSCRHDTESSASESDAAASEVIEKPAESTPSDPPKADALRLSIPEKTRFAPEITAVGTLKPERFAELAMAVPGILTRVSVKRGQEVKVGQILAVLDTLGAEASLAQAEAGIAAAEAGLEAAEDAVKRVTVMSVDGATTEAEVVQTKGKRDLALAQRKVATAQRDQARVLLRNHTLKAPFSGVITRAPDGTGMSVGPQAPLFAVEDIHSLVLQTSLTQEEVSSIPRKARCSVVVPATGARTDDASVRLILPSVDPATDRVPVEISVPNQDGRFMAHASAKVVLPSAFARDVYRVRESSLTQDMGSFSLWMVGADGKATAVYVHRMGFADNGDVLVDPGPDGFPKGARVVENPPLDIAAGKALAEPTPRGAPP